MAEKTRLDHLQESLTDELIAERKRRRTEALRDCSNQELEEELAKRPGYDPDPPPRYVEK